MNKASLCTFFFSCAALLGAVGCNDHQGEASITVQGPGRVRSNPAGIDCDSAGGDCSAELGQNFELSAQPNANAHFDHWEGDEECVNPGRANVVVGRAPDRKVSCTAVFADGAPPEGTNTL